MSKKIFILLLVSIFLVSCQKGTEDIKKFTDDYTAVTQQLRDARAKVKTRDDYVAFKAERKKSYEDLLEKYKESPNVDDIEILRCKALLALKKVDDAEKKIDAVLAKDPDNIDQANMVKVKVLLEQKKYDEAHNIFKGIEARISDPFDLFSAYYYLGSGHKDIKVKEGYATKFLNGENRPDYFKRFLMNIYLTLNSIYKMSGDFDKAKKLLEDGIAATEEERTKKFLSTTKAQIDYYGQEAFPLNVENWLNSENLKLENLKGKVVVLSLWAPWCPSCRVLTPSIIEIYNENKDKDFVMIGFTRFYGTYRDDEKDHGKVEKDEELELIKKYVAKKKMIYPIGIADNKDAFESYKISGIPTLIFIDKKGNVNYTKIGGGNVDFIKEKIKALLEET